LTVKWRWQPVFGGGTTKKRSLTFLRKKVHPGDLAGGFSHLEMTWLLYCTGAPTASSVGRMSTSESWFGE